MTEKRIFGKSRKSRNTFIAIAIFPIITLILMVVLFVYGELQGIKSTYHIKSEDIDSPYSIFDKVLLLNSYTSYDYLDLQDKAMRNADIFLDKDFLEKENAYLQDKYSFLAVIIDGKYTFFGNEQCYDDISMSLLQVNNNISGENSQYYGMGANRYLFKKLGINLSDGQSGSVCIVTDLNVNLPHITIFTMGLIIMVVVISVLVIIAIIGYGIRSFLKRYRFAPIP